MSAGRLLTQLYKIIPESITVYRGELETETWPKSSRCLDVFPKAGVPPHSFVVLPDLRIKGSSPPAAFLEGERVVWQNQVSNSSKVGTACPKLREPD